MITISDLASNKSLIPVSRADRDLLLIPIGEENVEKHKLIKILKERVLVRLSKESSLNSFMEGSDPDTEIIKLANGDLMNYELVSEPVASIFSNESDVNENIFVSDDTKMEYKYLINIDWANKVLEKIINYNVFCI